MALPINAGVETPHGAMSGIPAGGSAGAIVFTAPAGSLVAPGATLTVGFNNPNPSGDADWLVVPAPAGGGGAAVWPGIVGGPGPVGSWTLGPVHAPVPETAATMGIIGGALLIGALWRRWKA